MNYCDGSIHQPFVSPHKTSLSGPAFVIFHQNQTWRQLKLDLVRSEAFTPADFESIPAKVRSGFASGNAKRQIAKTNRWSVFALAEMLKTGDHYDRRYRTPINHLDLC
jgi:hypothetical protein